MQETDDLLFPAAYTLDPPPLDEAISPLPLLVIVVH
jgi:hypothetical protein